MVRGSMQLRGWVYRILRLAFIAFSAWLAFVLLDPRGLGWMVLVAMGICAAIFVGYRFALIRRQRGRDAQADRWAEALMSPPARPAAIQELRQAIAAMGSPSKKSALSRARLSLVLAELLDADGEPQGATEVLRAVDVGALPARMAAVIGHARAVAALSAGDASGASAILDTLAGTCGDPSVDLRIRLLRGLVAVEVGKAEEALALAEEGRIAAGDDEDLRVDARVLKAVALDALDEHDDAMKVMRAIRRDMLEVLLVLGLPRVKRLAEAVLAED